MLTRDPKRFARPHLAEMTSGPRARILVDLSHAAGGYVGVAQDLRLIFAMLCGIDGLEVSGLLMPVGRHDLPRIGPGRPDEAALTASVLHWMERRWSRPERRPMPFALMQNLAVLRQLVRRRHRMLKLGDRTQHNALWRVLFAKTLGSEQREAVLAHDFYATDLSVSSIIDLCVHPPVPLHKRLAAEHFDAVLFCMPRPVRLPPGMRQIVRFHDAVPVTDADTVQTWKMAMAHSRLVRACAPDAIFVCNSPSSRDALISLDPRRAIYSVVIPCAVAPAPPRLEGIDPNAVIARHISFRALGAGQAGAPAGWQAPFAGMRYILSVSTLEPRKNFSGLIRGWERVIARGDPDLRLVIVGEAGWREDEVLAYMRPGVASGRILHLQHLPQEDLQAVMRHAVCFVSPSFNEGFGYTPLEAMQAGVPCVVSDLPVFRWIFGDAAIYVDPYDTNAIATGIEHLTSAPGWRALGALLQSRSGQVLARFTPLAIGQAWEALLQTLSDGSNSQARHSVPGLQPSPASF